MKNTLITILACLLPLTAFGGPKDTILPPMEPSSSWFVGAGVEHMDYYDTELYTLKAGKRFDITNDLSYSLFGEVGTASIGWKSETIDLVPVTFNSDIRYELTPQLFVYAGAGAGTMYWANLPEGNSWTLVGQTFAGLGYKLTDSLEVTAQARYMVSEKDFDDWSYGVNVTYTF